MAGGRPPMFNTPEELERKVDEYFKTETDQTWTGLALHLGFNSRQALNYYMDEKPEFLDPLKKALSKIEIMYEKGLKSKNPAGYIFALKNFNWKDKIEQEQSGGTKNEFKVTIIDSGADIPEESKGV